MIKKKTIHFKNALITGATGDIGIALAYNYIKEGYNLYFISYSENLKKIKKLKKFAKKKGVNCKYVKIDFDNDNVLNWKKKITKLFASLTELHLLINNAGFLNQKQLNKIDEIDWNKALNINLKSVFFITQICEKYFAKEASIINISSIGGQIGGELAPHYAAAKSGVISLTKSFSKILSKKKIRVNCIAPGVIQTKMVNKMIKKYGVQKIIKNHLIKRLGTPEDIVNACCYLSDKKSNFITGHILNINGGSFLG